MLYGLVENTYPTSLKKFWSCYKVVAPTTGTLNITFRACCYNSAYPFTIHVTSDDTQPTYNSSTNRIIAIYDSTYKSTDGIATLDVVAGETYYIHFQHNRRGSSTSFGACIRSIELIPSEE